MCDICTGYFHVDYKGLNTAGENQLCPTGALVREFIAEQVGVGRFEYHVHKELCIGCGKCVQGCAMMNGSLFLQVQHDRCVNCNECSIALASPNAGFPTGPANTTVPAEVESPSPFASGDRRAGGRLMSRSHLAGREISAFAVPAICCLLPGLAVFRGGWLGTKRADPAGNSRLPDTRLASTLAGSGSARSSS